MTRDEVDRAFETCCADAIAAAHMGFEGVGVAKQKGKTIGKSRSEFVIVLLKIAFHAGTQLAATSGGAFGG